MEQKSVFELILSGELDSEIIYEDDEIFAINDINPVAKVHILIIPKRKIETINDTSLEDQNLLGKMILVAKDLAKKYNINDSGYRYVIRINVDGSIPRDNPKFQGKSDWLPEIYQIGIRNPQGLALSPFDGKIYMSNHSSCATTP